MTAPSFSESKAEDVESSSADRDTETADKRQTTKSAGESSDIADAEEEEEEMMQKEETTAEQEVSGSLPILFILRSEPTHSFAD